MRETQNTRVEYSVTIKSQFDFQLEATGVLLKIPCPPNTASAKIKVTTGKAKYVAAESALVWKISRFPGGAEHMFQAEVGLLATISKKAWSRPPIQVAFEVPMFTASGLSIRFLKGALWIRLGGVIAWCETHSRVAVLEPKLTYNAVKWLRSSTRGGSTKGSSSGGGGFQVRMG